ncbi:hypothetical protein [Fibrella aestuarina]|uniref:hypothetical protein n=1 Tax=Fibrella aestuarina TaxID=651143 RepID=UPI00059CB68E|nr:hypothetical protein [Fibrella aestuarina]
MLHSVEEVLQLNSETIYEQIGELAIQHQGLRGIEMPEEKREVGKSLFDAYQSQLRSKICNNKKLIKVMQSEELNTSVNIASLIVSIINPIVIPGSAVLISVLLVKYGILKYCEVI